MRNWKIAGVLATLVIALCFPLYLWKVRALRIAGGEGRLEPAAFVGSKNCKDCHKREYDKWMGSHHERAMDVASDATVLGDFNDAVFDAHGVTSRFYRKDGKFLVHTQGAGGKMGDFEITHTFGWFPLQQYLIPFPGGRLQCLPVAWDVKGKRWFRVPPDEPIDPKDWLYWTNGGQNWNSMCAECHSTNLRKNFDIRTDSYRTSWSEISLGCEACHGPGSRHVAWAQLPDMARPRVENAELVMKTSGLSSRKLVELCAPCHARRASLTDYTHAEKDFLDTRLPQLLTEGLYYPDGQILDEVFEYGSFTQSKMYHRGVRCSDCHDVHSIKPVKEGNDLCLQCHRAAEYDRKEHHFHKKKDEKGEPIVAPDGSVLFDVGTGAECAQCHMAGRYYMGVDYRFDHSFRIARPDLSLRIGTPNGCHRCHQDKTDAWCEEQMTQWYGPGRKPHYGTILDAGRRRTPEAHTELIRLAGDPLYPVIVRATALSLLRGYPGGESDLAMERALKDDEALIRRTAVDLLGLTDPARQAALLGPLLYDPVKAVRIEAARRLAEGPMAHLPQDERKTYAAVLREFEVAMEYAGDFASGRYNLANLYGSLNRPEEAVRNFRAAIAIDDLFFPAKVNLAMLYDHLGKKEEAERLLREVIQAYPENHNVAYSLGLLLAERGKLEEAAAYLERAARGLPERARVHYNLGLLLQQLQRTPQAEVELRSARELEPDSLDFLFALADHYVKRARWVEVRELALDMVRRHPRQRVGHDLLDLAERNLGATRR
jgi:tetratricopeptide (TPR) repeat protein